MKTKRQLQKKATQLKRKEERKQFRLIKREEKQKYRDFVKAIKERDNYTCQISGKYLKDADPRALVVAHILSKENYPELMLNPNNVLSLSYYHHKNSFLSPHLDCFAFIEWFKGKFPERYCYLLKWLGEEQQKGLIKPTNATG